MIETENIKRNMNPEPTMLQRNPIRVVAVDPMMATQSPKRTEINIDTFKKRRYPALR